MPLAPGHRLGSHEIISLLGAGGMGEVYLAHDTKLNRRVAVKILPDAYARDSDRIARFHREAQAVAALNHSGIAAIYDFAEADGANFLVLELIEGDTLADRLRRGPVPVEEALQIAKQILEALEAAHERGICHRDLKPANIKLTPDGGVKVLDFGLAKFLQSASTPSHLSQSPTFSLAGTYPGLILGTAGYMSPEQAKGFDADHRSDLFSFGCILYELLAGRQAFEGDTASEILASVLKSDVDWTRLPAHLNPRLVEVLRRCLEKNPKKRWHAAADVRVEIESLIGRGVVVDNRPAPTPSPGRVWTRAASAALFAIVGAGLGAYGAWTLRPLPTSHIMRFTIPLPEGQLFSNQGRQALALSPDGTQLVYVANNRLFLRPLAGLDARPIQGSELPGGVNNPAFSPDGLSIAFRAEDNTLKRLALSGGAPVTICPVQGQPYGLSWHDDAIVFAIQQKGILKVSPNGGVPEVIAAVAADEVVEGPQLLPDDRGVMFSVRKNAETWNQAQVVVQPLDGGARKTVVNGGADARYLPTGHLAYALGGVVLVVPFDLATLSVTGGPVPLIEGVRRGAALTAGNAPSAALFAVSRNGTLAYLPGPSGAMNTTQTDLGIFDAKGNVEPLNLTPGLYPRAPRVTRDGRWVAFEHADEKSSFISVHEIGGSSVARRLTFDTNSRAPLWSPDGEWVVFASDREGAAFALYRTRADGSGTAERLTTPEKGTSHAPQTWSRDGQQLVFSVEQTGTIEGSRLWLLSLRDRKVSPLGDMAARDATISPDGRWIAYGTRRAAANHVFVEPFPTTGAKYLLPQVAGHPVWTPKGDALITNGSPLLSHITPVTTIPAFAFRQSVEFPRRGRQEANPLVARRQIDMMPDGRVIGVINPGAQSTAPSREIVVVLNWFEEVRQRVPLR
jgi:serine/threonine-protein kinase